MADETPNPEQPVSVQPGLRDRSTSRVSPGRTACGAERPGAQSSVTARTGTGQGGI